MIGFEASLGKVREVLAGAGKRALRGTLQGVDFAWRGHSRKTKKIDEAFKRFPPSKLVPGVADTAFWTLVFPPAAALTFFGVGVGTPGPAFLITHL